MERERVRVREEQMEAFMMNTEDDEILQRDRLFRIKRKRRIHLFIVLCLTILFITVFYIVNVLFTRENNPNVLKEEDLVVLKQLVEYYKRKESIEHTEPNQKEKQNGDDSTKIDRNMQKVIEAIKNKDRRKTTKEIEEEFIEILKRNNNVDINIENLSNIIDQLISFKEKEVDPLKKEKKEYILLSSIGREEQKNERTKSDNSDNGNNSLNELEKYEEDIKKEFIFSDVKYSTLFHEFIQTYNKTYKNVKEKKKRYEHFKNNYKHIETHNETESLYKKGINRFSDYSKDEINNYFKKLWNVPQHLIKTHAISFSETLQTDILKEKQTPPLNNINKIDVATYTDDISFLERKKIPKETNTKKKVSEQSVSPYPVNLDFREKGLVSKIKDQKNCGACYSFASVANIESLYAKKYNKLLNFSEQEILDCSKLSYGCDGGHPFFVFHYVINNGLCLYDDYKYIGKENLFCLTFKCSDKVHIRSVGHVEENELIKALNVVGPITVNVAASMDFIFYKSGIFNGPCAPYMNHSVLLIGYGQIEKQNKNTNTEDKKLYEEVTKGRQTAPVRWTTNTDQANCNQTLTNEESGQEQIKTRTNSACVSETEKNTNSDDKVDHDSYDGTDEAENNEDYDDGTIYYWIIANSWGKDWGENGFMRIIRNKNGDDQFCGIGQQVFYPIL